MTDALGGNVPLVYTAVAGALQHVKAGRLTPIAVSSNKRVGSLPDVPTFIEIGVADFEVTSWVAILAPGEDAEGRGREAQPRAQRGAHGSGDRREARDPRHHRRRPGSPQALADQIRTDLAKYGPVVKAAGIKAE
jgi:tripartite-type tricarboxylate transporter receptor subunit TctC